MQLKINVFFGSVFNYFSPRSSSLRCPCEEQPVLGARPPAKPNLDDAAPGSPGAFSFLLRPLCRRSPLSPPTALLLQPSPSRRGPRTAKGALINHLTRSSSVFIHPSGSLFSFFFFFVLFLPLLICTALSGVTMVSYCPVHSVGRFIPPFAGASRTPPLSDSFPPF